MVDLVRPAPSRDRGGPAPPLTYAAWSVLESRERHGGTRFLALPSRGVLNPPAVTGMGFWSINPYIGCEFGCAYCYARETHRWTVERAANRMGAPAAAREAAALPAAEAFERRILVKQGAPALLARALDPVRIAGRPIVIGTATDPYQPAERSFGLTRALLEALRHFQGLRVGIITKSTLIARDLPLLKELALQHDLTVHASLASLDAPLLRRIEPRTPIPEARLRTMAKLADAGLDVGLLAAPILPALTDDEPALRALFTAAHRAGARWATGEPLRLGRATRHTLLPWLERERPHLAERYRRHYGTRNGVGRDYAAALQARIKGILEELGVPNGRGKRKPRGQMELAFEA